MYCKENLQIVKFFVSILRKFNLLTPSVLTGREIADFNRARRERAIGGTDPLETFHPIAFVHQQLEHVDDDAVSDRRLLAAFSLAETEFESQTWRAFWMTTVDDLAANDVASDLGITRNAVYLAKSRILKRLRPIFQNC